MHGGCRAAINRRVLFEFRFDCTSEVARSKRDLSQRAREIDQLVDQRILTERKIRVVILLQRTTVLLRAEIRPQHHSLDADRLDELEQGLRETRVFEVFVEKFEFGLAVRARCFARGETTDFASRNRDIERIGAELPICELLQS